MGTGIHGGFGLHTKGAVPPVLAGGDVRYSKKKIVDYLLNEKHIIGASKAKFMKEVLGYTAKDARLFHKRIVESIIGKMPTKTEITEYGTKHTYHTKLIGRSDKGIHANIVVLIQKDKNRITYKIVTVYPDKKR